MILMVVFLADCGTDKRAKRVQYLLQEGKDKSRCGS